jgi:hypothetical protein
MFDLGATTECATKLIYVSHLVYFLTRQADRHTSNHNRLDPRHLFLGVLEYDDHGQQRTKQLPRRNTLHDSLYSILLRRLRLWV